MTVIFTLIVIFALVVVGPHIPYPEPLDSNNNPTMNNPTMDENNIEGLQAILNMSWEYKGVDR